MPSSYRLLRAPSTLPRIDNSEGSWRAKALCAQRVKAGTAEAWWFDDKVGPDDVREDVETRARRVAQAKAVCQSCPVRAECDADVDLTLDDGIRAGVDLRAARAEQAS